MAPLLVLLPALRLVLLPAALQAPKPVASLLLLPALWLVPLPALQAPEPPLLVLRPLLETWAPHQYGSDIHGVTRRHKRVIQGIGDALQRRWRKDSRGVWRRRGRC